MLKNGIRVSVSHAAAIALLCTGSGMICGCSDESFKCGEGMHLDEFSNMCQPECGDGIVVRGEECDDDNIISGDGCSASCKLEGRACITDVEPTFCPEVCEPQIDCGGGKCEDTLEGPVCVCEGYIGPNCKTKKCEMTAGQNFTIAVDSQGTVMAWGENMYGQLADPNLSVNESRPLPAPIHAPQDMADIHKLNAYPAGNHVLALDSKGELWLWGDPSYGKLGGTKSKDSDILRYDSTGAIKGP